MSIFPTPMNLNKSKRIRLLVVEGIYTRYYGKFSACILLLSPTGNGQLKTKLESSQPNHTDKILHLVESGSVVPEDSNTEKF